MLAALFRRASRMVLGLTAVAIVGAGLSLSPTGLFGTAALAVETASDAVEISIFPTTNPGVTAGQDLAVTITVTNDSDQALGVGQVVVTTGSAVLNDAAGLSDWLTKADGEQQPGRWLGVVDTPAVATGSTVTLTATLSLDNALYGSDWGPRGLAADLEVDGTSAGSGRGVLVWTTSSAPAAARLVTVVPLVSPASASGLLTADELTVLTSPQGVLTSQLAIASGRDVTLAVDPRIIASIITLGTNAPSSATEWLARLDALPNESFELAYADADVALQAQAGATQLTTAHFSDQPILAPVETPTPSASAGASDSVPNTPASDAVTTDGAWSPSLTGITWPAENTVVASDLNIFSASGSLFTLLSSSNVASGPNSAAHTAIGGQPALITNAGLSRAMRNASSALDDATWEHNFSLAAAYLAATALTPSTQGVALAALSRDSLGEVSQARSSQTLDRLASLNWVDSGTLTAVTTSASAADTTVVDKPESDERVLAARGILALQASVTAFSSVLTTPALLTDKTTRQELALLSLAWRSGEGWGGAIAGFQQDTFATVNSIRIVPSSEIQMVGGQVNIPVTIENSLALPVTVLVRATPSNARLTVDSDATVEVQGKAQAKALVPVKARIGNGSVLLSLSLYSPTGVGVGSAVSLPVNVRADWESWGLGGLSLLFAALLTVGVVRTVRKRRRESLSPSAEADVLVTNSDVSPHG